MSEEHKENKLPEDIIYPDIIITTAERFQNLEQRTEFLDQKLSEIEAKEDVNSRLDLQCGKSLKYYIDTNAKNLDNRIDLNVADARRRLNTLENSAWWQSWVNAGIGITFLITAGIDCYYRRR